MAAILTAPSSAPNSPNQRGSLASSKVRFGDFGRFAVAAVHTRFDAVAWFVWDAETPDDITDMPAVIRQAGTFSEAVGGMGYLCKAHAAY
jgi:hypothetical protein